MSGPRDVQPVQVIGIGTGGLTRLSGEAVAALQHAELIIGAEHQFHDIAVHLSGSLAEQKPYPSPLSGLKNLLDESQEKRVVLLASGDPLFFGIGAWLRRTLGPERLRFHANISSVQSAFARLALPWQQAQVVTLHGRPLSTLKSRLGKHRLYALLTDAQSTPQRIAATLVESGFADARLWVCEDLGGSEEQIRSFNAQELQANALDVHPLNVVIVQTGDSTGRLPEFPGIPDEAFETGAEPGRGMLSKREVRVNMLSLLQPGALETGWDIGAGCGGVAVEWARWNPLGEVYALERDAERLAHLNTNRERFGVSANLQPVLGEAPKALDQLPDPDKIFVGGSGGELPELLERCWSRLKPGGRLVVAAVTLQSRALLLAFADRRPEIEQRWSEIAVSRGDTLGRQLILRPLLPVLLASFDKPRVGESNPIQPQEADA